ncbi:helix-turn-helix DNA-binding domain protein [Mycobacterium phage Acolyte]|nr:helix-turn-helix DNA-binding domain protein [Mycobacterium phage Acolyte]
MVHSLVAPDVLARRIRMIMGGQKLTRKHLAEASGISRPSIANKLDGKVAFTYDELLRVVEILDVAWEDLFAEDEDDRPIRLRDFRARTDRSL